MHETETDVFSVDEMSLPVHTQIDCSGLVAPAKKLHRLGY